MIATNDRVYKNLGDYWARYRFPLKEYTIKEVNEIIQSGDISRQQQMSRVFFVRDGLYRQIVLYYATLLKYVGLLIPNPSNGKSLSTSHISKRYYNALDLVDQMSIESFATNCAIRAIVDGSYYGVISDRNKNGFCVIDLPPQYCKTNYKDENNNDLIEFDVGYFDSLANDGTREMALTVFPSFISKRYRKWKNGRSTSSKIIIPGQIGICFPFFEGRPLFLHVIPSTLEYDAAIDIERERDLEEIRKIIVQKIPHLNDGQLLFEPEEAAEIHKGVVDMMRSNENISVLTTYADVDAIISKTSADRADNALERMLNNVYAEAGVSSQVFASNGTNTLEASTKYDLALMMYFGNKVANFITNYVNTKYANSNITFKYKILPVTYQNEQKYVDETFKLASSGYSFLLPVIASGLSQKEIINIKDLENDVLDLGDKLRPLKSSFTSDTSGEGSKETGRPKKEEDQKADKTIQNEESLEKVAENGGSD